MDKVCPILNYFLPPSCCSALRERRHSMEELFSQVANLGFPIIVSIYLLVRVEAKLDELTKSIHELSSAIAQK